ncbi:DMT family transporter [Aneurinibacillus sp. UBA3580]|jgi:drug/metabolite transporter (DMT)-like permease|uniref:DMT family transporter n=1 Tax=Aneurinibacillus sp. UBA3580 TaxID=1946041 RepID=UPI002579C305|nr:DMT family transporter [Aneurinibacillus sp. UBA3580]
MIRVSPYVLLVLANVLWGGNFVIGRAITESLPPYTLSFLRWCTALIVFLPFIWSSLRKEWPLLRQKMAVIILMAFTGITGFNTLLYIALHYTTSINASLVNTSTPIVIYILSFFILRERLNKNQTIGTIFSLVGVLFIISKGSLDTLLAFSFNLGDLLVIAALICWSIYSILVKRYTDILPGYSTFFVCILIGIAILFPFSMYEIFVAQIPVVWSTGSVLTVLYTGIFASIVAFISWNSAVSQVGAGKAGIFLNLIPVFASIFAILFIGEHVAWYQTIGGLFVVLGVYISTRIVNVTKNNPLSQNENAG